MFKKNHSTNKNKQTNNPPPQKKKNNPQTNRTTKLLDIEITKLETHFRNVQNHYSSITHQIDDHDRARPRANRTNMSKYHMNEIYMNELDRSTTKEEVRQSIRNLKQGEAPGLDNVCGKYLKANKQTNKTRNKQRINYTTPFLTILFNKIYDSSCFSLKRFFF